MAQKKARPPANIIIPIIDGPAKGKEMRVCNPPIRVIRLSTPEWCTYEITEDGKAYTSVGDIMINYKNWLAGEEPELYGKI